MWQRLNGWMEISYGYQLMQVILNTVDIFLILGGNLLVLATLISNPRLLHPMNTYIMSMSMSGVVTGMLVPVNGYFASPFVPLLAQSSCIYRAIINVFFAAAVFNSVLCMLIIAAERYRSIVMLRGGGSPPSNGKRWIAVAIMWIIAFLWQLPLVFSDQRTGVYSVSSSPREEDWGKNYTYCIPKGSVPHIHYTLSAFLVYVIPVVFMGVLYHRIIDTVLANIRQYASNHPNRFVTPAPHSQRSKLRAVKAMSLVVIIFGACWLPGYALMLTAAWGLSDEVPNTFLYGQDIALQTAYAHNWLHVIVYPFYSHQFRLACRQVMTRVRDLFLLRACRRQRKGRVESTPVISTVHNVMIQMPL